MDVSISVNKLNEELVENLKQVVKGLKGERFGISIFNTSSVLLVPLTDDYQYVLYELDKLKQSFHSNNNYDTSSYDYPTSEYIFNGTLVGNEQRGSSIIADGLASAVYNFPKLDEKRSRVIIFSTDNELQGDQLLTLEQAGKLSKQNNITVFAISPNTITDEDKFELQSAVNITGGELYVENNKSTVSSIINNIQKKEKNKGNGQNQIRKIDQPQIPFILIVISMTTIFVLSKKVEI